MGAWGEGMQANDTALDYVAKYQNTSKEGLPLNKRGKDVVDGKLPILKELQAILKREDGMNGYGAMAILGVAEFFLDNGADLKSARSLIMRAIKNQLSKEELGTWGDMEMRRDAIERFKARLMGKKVDPKEVAKDNEGLFAKMGKFLGERK